MIKTTSCYPEMCECGRMYKAHRDATGKTMCPLCYTGLSKDDLKKLWIKNDDPFESPSIILTNKDSVCCQTESKIKSGFCL